MHETGKMPGIQLLAEGWVLLESSFLFVAKIFSMAWFVLKDLWRSRQGEKGKKRANLPLSIKGNQEFCILSTGNVGPSALAPAGPIPQLLCLIALPLATSAAPACVLNELPT